MEWNARLDVEALMVERGGRRVIPGLSFTAGSGEIITITGDNGAGKSTLLRALAGLLPLGGGHVAVAAPGKADPDALPGEAMHYLGHLDGLKAALTPLDNLRFAAAWLGHPETSPPRALSAVGLSHVAELPVGFLSAGQRRRVAFARLLVAARPVWLLDEPLTALDAASAAAAEGLMAGHAASGGIIVAAIHDPLGLPSRTIHLGSQ